MPLIHLVLPHFWRFFSKNGVFFRQNCKFDGKSYLSKLCTLELGRCGIEFWTLPLPGQSFLCNADYFVAPAYCRFRLFLDDKLGLLIDSFKPTNSQNRTLPAISSPVDVKS